MKVNRMLILLMFVSSLSGCAGGRNYDYRAISIDPLLDGNNVSIAVGVHDQRVYVKSGEKYPQYVGTQRSPAYVPWNVNTRSGKPMADDFLNNISKSLKSNGYKVDLVPLSQNDNKKQVLLKLKSTEANKLLLFTIKEWFFDVWYKTRMEYSIQLEVFDNELVLLASSKVEKKMWGENDNAVPDLEFKAAIEKLLSEDSVANVLEGKTAYATNNEINSIKPESSGKKDQDVQNEQEVVITKQNKPNSSSSVDRITFKCTTEQVLKMKEMGMAGKQIKAACQ